MPTAAPRWPASAASTTSLAPHEAPTALDTPYHQLATLPRGTWLPVLTAAVGTREARLAHAQAWLAALHAGELPATEADFADPAATAPLRQAVADLRLPALARGVDALGEQVLRTMLWHLDRLVDLQPRLTRAQAIAQAAQAFRDEWTLESQALEPDLALLRDLAGGSHLAWAELRGQLRQRGCMLPSEALWLRHPVLGTSCGARAVPRPAAGATTARRCCTTMRPDPQAPPRQAGTARRPRRWSAGRSSCAWTPRARCAARRRTWPRPCVLQALRTAHQARALPPAGLWRPG
jgi:hypothetical protein